jgi:RNA polymerase sigma-70 factor (ECF subfamily)
MDVSLREFENHRARLLAMASRWVGSTTEAEDIMSEAWLRWRRTPDVRNHGAFLATIVSRLCTDHLKSARVRREHCAGAALPEPPSVAQPTPQETVERDEEAKLVALCLLERLTPSERAVLVLHHAFGYSYREVSELLGIREAHCRQLYIRGRTRLAVSDRRFTTEPAKQAELAHRLVAASRAGELRPLERLLASDVAS